MLADRCGVFCEPASAVAIAGLCDEMKKGNIPDDSVVVCTLTGHGLKDPDVAIRQSPEPMSISKGGEGLKDYILSSID
jgi:threonine synthase